MEQQIADLTRQVSRIQHQVDLANSQGIQKFTAIRQKRQEVIENLEALASVVSDMEARLSAIEGIVFPAEHDIKLFQNEKETDGTKDSGAGRTGS